MDDLTNVALIRKLRGSLMCLAIFSSDLLSMGVCTTRHWQVPSRLVLELNFGTVGRQDLGRIFEIPF